MHRHKEQYNSSSNNKGGQDREKHGLEIASKTTLTVNDLKLAIALELKAEGYDIVVFDKIIEYGGHKVRAHVLCEDEVVGDRVAVYCISRACQVKPYEVALAISTIRNGIEDCEVALAFPLALLSKASVLMGMASRVYMVDDRGRVWAHYPWKWMHAKALPELPEKVAPEDCEGETSTRLRVFYIA